MAQTDVLPGGPHNTEPHPGGLSSAEAAKRLRRFGPNQAVAERVVRLRDRLWGAVKNPLVLLLLVLAIISYVTHDLRSAAVIASMAVLSVALKVIQEAKAGTAAARLKAMVHTTATVLRDGAKREIPLHRIVPGDVVVLAAGDMVPADVRLLESKDLHINQATLTGESMPVEKRAAKDAPAPPDSPGKEPGQGAAVSLDDPGMCFMGTNVISGSALALVVTTGPATYLGGVAAKLAEAPPQTDFDRGARDFTSLMLRFMAFMVPFVFLANGLLKGDWSQAFMFALAVAVGLTPEMLPMVVTVCLSKGALAMSRRKVIVKRLESIQNFGAVDILCMDKTGTLTQDRIILEKHLDVFGQNDDTVLEYAAINSHFQTGLKSALDHAVLDSAGRRPDVDTAKYRKVDEVPFDFDRRRMSVIVQDTEAGKGLLICKGASEEVFAASTRCLAHGRVEPIGEDHRQGMERLVRELNQDGFRVVAVGYKEADPGRSDFGAGDEADLILMGYLAFLDPPKEGAAGALRAMIGHGITPKILTGDNAVVTAHVCRLVGLDPGGEVVTGDHLHGLDARGLAALAVQRHVFAKLDPMQKDAIVAALRNAGHVVGFLGDGINDAPALKAADVGISVDTAVDVAKESADIILLEKSLDVLEQGVLEGRKVFANVTKYIRMGASSNFGNMFSVLGASVFLPFLPMLPIQILFNNLLYDLSQAAIPTDNVDEDFLAAPRRWRIDDIRRYILWLGPVSSLFDYVTFAVLIWAFGAWTEPGLFQTGWFVESLLSQTLVVHVIRTDKVPLLQSRSSLPLAATTLGICALGLWLPFSPLADYLGLVRPPHEYYWALSAILAAYLGLAQAVKTWLTKRLAQAQPA